MLRHFGNSKRARGAADSAASVAQHLYDRALIANAPLQLPHMQGGEDQTAGSLLPAHGSERRRLGLSDLRFWRNVTLASPFARGFDLGEADFFVLPGTAPSVVELLHVFATASPAPPAPAWRWGTHCKGVAIGVHARFKTGQLAIFRFEVPRLKCLRDLSHLEVGFPRARVEPRGSTVRFRWDKFHPRRAIQIVVVSVPKSIFFRLFRAISA